MRSHKRREGAGLNSASKLYSLITTYWRNVMIEMEEHAMEEHAHDEYEKSN